MALSNDLSDKIKNLHWPSATVSENTRGNPEICGCKYQLTHNQKAKLIKCGTH